MRFKSFALFAVITASASVLAQDHGHHSDSNSSDRSSSRSTSNSRSSHSNSGQQGGSRSNSWSGRSSGSSSWSGRSSNSGFGRSTNSGSYRSSENIWNSPNQTSQSVSRGRSGGNSSFGSTRSSYSQNSGYSSNRSYSGSQNSGHGDWSGRYTGEGASTYRNNGGDFGHHGSSTGGWGQGGGSRGGYSGGGYQGQYNGNRGGFGGNRYEGGGFGGHGFDRGDRGNVIVRNNFVYASPIWGGGWRSGWSRPAGWGFSLSFGFYLNDRFAAPCYASPWYFYAGLPPYIPASRCIVVPNYYCDWSEGAVYRWHYEDGYGENRALDEAVDEIHDAYANHDLGAVDALVSHDSQVAISADGHYQYSLHPDEFHDMFTDSVQGTHTVSFRVEEVRRYGNRATVRCEHRFQVPDGGEETVVQVYRLRDEGGRFIVTDFMTQHPSEF